MKLGIIMVVGVRPVVDDKILVFGFLLVVPMAV